VQSGGWSASLLPRTTDWRFDYNLAALDADFVAPFRYLDAGMGAEGVPVVKAPDFLAFDPA
jgi:hypothetical protein